MIGDIKGMFYNELVNKLTIVIFMKVRCSLVSTFILFLITKIIMNSWELVGNKDELKLSKGDMVLKFDIKVLAIEGILFCIYLRHSNNET